MTNRQEVAEKLRQAGESFKESCCSGATVFVTVKDIIGISKAINYKTFFDRLADLIDPTCELKIQDGHACCGNCGHRLAGEYEEEEDYWCFRPYCPDCGARVVRDE